MKKVVFLLAFMFVASATTYAQNTEEEKEDQFSIDVKKCIKSNGTITYYEDVVDQMMGMLEKQFESQNVPASLWKELKDRKELSMNQLQIMIVSAYRGHFTHQDVKNMNALYTTSAGKNMFIKKNEELSADDKAVLNAFYTSDTGEKIIGSQGSMNKAMEDISIKWSGDMYKRIIDILSAKGYSL